MDKVAVVTAAKDNKCLYEILRSLAKRDRWRKNSDLRRMRYTIEEEAGLIVSTREFREQFRFLEQCGFGKLTPGTSEKHEPDRFEWTVNYVDFAQEALRLIHPKSDHHEGPNTDSNTVVFPLRGNVIRLDLPKDLTLAEAEQLSSFIRKLAS